MKNKVIGIYKITCKETGRCYIGQSKNINLRWKQHQSKRFPVNKFDYEIIREVSQVSFLNAFEKYYIKFYDSHQSGFNKTIGGTDIKLLFPSEETKLRWSQVRKGRIPHNKGKKGLYEISEETRKKLSESSTGRLSPMKGKKLSEETKRKMSESSKGKNTGPQQKFSCVYCDRLFNAGNLKQYHNDNCKIKEKI